MRTKNINSQYRRDFRATFICPFCGYEEEMIGYDDWNFHHNVIPKMKCPKCGKCENDGNSYRPLETKYPEGFQI